MKRVALIIQYDGSYFSGWQRQTNAISVQETIENCLFEISKQHVKTFASGRTDAGVHAIGQCANYIMKKEYTEYQVLNGINFHLGIEKI